MQLSVCVAKQEEESSASGFRIFLTFGLFPSWQTANAGGQRVPGQIAGFPLTLAASATIGTSPVAT